MCKKYNNQLWFSGLITKHFKEAFIVIKQIYDLYDKLNPENGVTQD